MTYTNNVRNRVKKLRLCGKSIRQIASEVGLSVSTVSLWLRDMPKSVEMSRLIRRHEMRGRARGLAAIAAARDLQRRRLKTEAAATWIALNCRENDDFWRVCAALLFWCEGAKRLSNLAFANSDPAMIALFLSALRRGFAIDEGKLRVQLHLHEYHDVSRQIRYWSKVTGIPHSRFSRPYVKPHTGKQKRDGYPGCVSLRYGDARLAQKLSFIYHALAESDGGVG